MKPANLLEKYDEEIDGEKKESFTLGKYVQKYSHQLNEERIVYVR